MVGHGQAAARTSKRRRCNPEQLEAWHVLNTLPRHDQASGAEQAERPRLRHSWHWVRCTHGDRAVYWNSETRQLSLDAPHEGAHFYETVANQGDFDGMWVAAKRSDLDRSVDANSGEEECLERGESDRIAETLAAGAPGGCCSSSWGWGRHNPCLDGQQRSRRAVLQEKRAAARHVALVAELRHSARQRYLCTLSASTAAEADSDDQPDPPEGVGGGPSTDSTDNSTDGEDALGEAAEAAIDAVAVGCATMVTSLINTITRLGSDEVEPLLVSQSGAQSSSEFDSTGAPTASSEKRRAPTKRPLEKEDAWHNITASRVLDAARLLGLPEQVSHLSTRESFALSVLCDSRVVLARSSSRPSAGPCVLAGPAVVIKSCSSCAFG